MINNEVMGMEHLAFRITDLDEGLKFFSKILGFKVNFRFQYDGLRIAILEAGKAKIEIWEDRSPEGDCVQENCPGEGNNEVAVSVKRLGDILRNIKENGYVIVKDVHETEHGLREAIVAGPDNIKVQFVEKNMMSLMRGALKDNLHRLVRH